jgi:hypothetical protein
MGRALLRVVAIAMVAAVSAVAAGAAGVAAAAPMVTLEQPANHSTTNNATPSFGGLAEEAAGEVTLTIYSGTNVNGTQVQALTTLTAPFGGLWELVAEHLTDGTYTAQAAQTDLGDEETGKSAPSPSRSIRQPPR